MNKCKSCSAPLPVNSCRCSYCNVRNDLDLQGKHHFNITQKDSDRSCPHCQIQMQTIELQLKEPVYIERCGQCFGLFFDPGEIEILLQSTVSNIFDINLDLMSNINKDRYRKQEKFKYIKCPVCLEIMNRVNFAHRSGVVVDQCRLHGIWLDNGEITHLMEWKKAGGELLHEKNKSQKKEKKTIPYTPSVYEQYPSNHSNQVLDIDLLETLGSLVFKLFK